MRRLKNCFTPAPTSPTDTMSCVAASSNPAQPTRPARLADVAARAGVVAMTASRALTGKGYVSAAVRARVLAAAEELRYRPNLLARSLRGSRSDAIGVLLPNISNPFSAELLHGMNDVLLPAGYTPFLATAEHGAREERTALQTFFDHRVDGLIVVTREVSALDDTLVSLTRRGASIVTVGKPHTLPDVDMVAADDRQGAYDATMHLIGLGHTRIAFLGGLPNAGFKLRRHAGYQDAMTSAGLPCENELNFPAEAYGFATQEDGFRCMEQAMRIAAPPSAVLARNDACAIGALHAAHTLRLRVPNDVAVVGFDDIPLAAYQAPPLTTVAQPIREQGAIAAQFLLQRLRGETRERQNRVLACRLIERASTLGSAAVL